MSLPSSSPPESGAPASLSRRYTESQGSVHIVVPCYNEAQRLNVPEFERCLSEEPAIHFVFVNDGSKDQTSEVLRQLASRWPVRVTAMDLPQNVGKAEAVRAGLRLCFTAPGAAFVGFWDADLATPLDAIDQFVATLERRADLDMVLGSRVQLLGRSILRKPIRHYLGRVFATAASLTLSLPVYDTQCGAKLFRVKPNVSAIFEQPFNSRWIFDVEILARYLKATAGQKKIFELPLDRWEDIGDSRVRSVDFLRAAGELARIYRTYRLSSRYQGLFDLLTAPFIRYAGAGALGTALHYTATYLSVRSFSATPMTGTIIGASIGAMFNYLINYHFTFASNKSHQQSLPRFLLVAAVGIALSGYTVKYLTEQAGLHFMLGQLVATLLVLVLGFVANKVWTFAND